ncbi:LOW QUALITY PROTEIN: C1orf159 isoform 4 [Pongo abelii]|uniref:C1orf159 isoform 4 n=1 Tax=Pongo abelii TaxID=9601 RepID=A0A2J8R756_PONAB|nr:LOW QUALITY PROTEIN: C1orf159 isoform 4 [Pongo abelii]
MALRHLALLAGLLVGVASKSMENMDTDVPAPEVLTRSTVGVRGACASQRGALCCLPGEHLLRNGWDRWGPHSEASPAMGVALPAVTAQHAARCYRGV